MAKRAFFLLVLMVFLMACALPLHTQKFFTSTEGDVVEKSSLTEDEQAVMDCIKEKASELNVLGVKDEGDTLFISVMFFGNSGDVYATEYQNIYACVLQYASELKWHDVNIVDHWFESIYTVDDFQQHVAIYMYSTLLATREGVMMLAECFDEICFGNTLDSGINYNFFVAVAANQRISPIVDRLDADEVKDAIAKWESLKAETSEASR